MENSLRLLTIRFGLLSFFFPLFISYARIGDQNVERFAIAQPASDATFASLLCQDSTHLLRRLSRSRSDGVDFVVDFLIADFDLFFISNTLEQQRTAQIIAPCSFKESRALSQSSCGLRGSIPWPIMSRTTDSNRCSVWCWTNRSGNS